MCVCVCGKDATEVTSYDTFPSGRQSSLPLLPLASLRCSCRWFARPPWMDVACMRWAAARLTLGLRGGNLIYEGNLKVFNIQISPLSSTFRSISAAHARCCGLSSLSLDRFTRRITVANTVRSRPVARTPSW